MKRGSLLKMPTQCLVKGKCVSAGVRLVKLSLPGMTPLRIGCEQPRAIGGASEPPPASAIGPPPPPPVPPAPPRAPPAPVLPPAPVDEALLPVVADDPDPPEPVVPPPLPLAVPLPLAPWVPSVTVGAGSLLQ